MLSMYTLKSANEASKYYQQGDYYTQDATDSYSGWLGKGAERLNLSGPVDFIVFKNLLEGRLPTGEEMLQTKTGKHHRPGYDLTFSAPKSVSILALVAKNEAVLNAHREAVQETFSKIEEIYSGYRARKNKDIHLEKTDNILVAAFEHCDSREGDPQLHTHGVLMNMTQRQDGAWRTLYADELYNDKIFNGMEYRSLLAQKLMQLGYEINIGPKGTFEIKDISPELIQAFSKRRHQIKTWLDDRDLSGGEAATVANFQTRKAKQSTPLEKLEDRWLQELENHGSSIEKLQQHALAARLRGPVVLPDPALIAENAVIFAIEHLSEWKTHFSLKDVMDAAKALSLIPNNDADCLKSIESRAKTSELIYIGEGKFTTPKAAQLENENNLNMQQGKEKVSPILINLIAKYITNRTLTEKSEQEALKFMLTSKDQQILISSHGKERLNEILKVFNTVCEDQKYYPRLLVSRTNQCETLKDSTGMSRVIGIDEFLLSREMRMDAKDEKASGLGDYFEQLGKPARDWQAREIWVVQANLSLKQLNRLQHWAKTFSARIIFAQTSKNEAHLPHI